MTTAGIISFVYKSIAAYALGAIANSLLLKKPDRDGSSNALLGLPIGNTDNGAPRVWAIGSRVRVPAQVMWMQRKVREVSSGPKKGGGATQHVTFDCAFMLNDRPTSRMLQFITNDQLLIWDSRNLVHVETSAMTVSESGGDLLLTMDSLFEEDWADLFEVDDVIELSNFRIPSGPNINTGFWKVKTVVGHTTTPSVLTLGVYSSQSLVSLAANAGNVFAPARVTRIDDRVVGENLVIPSVNPSQDREIQGDVVPTKVQWDDVFVVNEDCHLLGAFVPNFTGSGLRVYRQYPEKIITRGTHNSPGGGAQYGVTFGTSTDAAIIQAAFQRTAAAGFFPQTFFPSTHFFAGTNTQNESPIISEHEGAGQVGGFRGTCYQVFDDFDVTNFGGVLPPATEALIQVDTTMSWAAALTEVAVHGGLDRNKIDVGGVHPRPFRGYFIRGPVSGVQSLQPLLVAGMIATQERNGTLAFFAIDNADSVAIHNGAVFTDFGAQVNVAVLEKWTYSEVDERDLPSAVSVRYQDPGAGYGANLEQFGRRFPSVREDQQIVELDFRTLVLSRREARNLCSTVARRSRINSRSVLFTLPATYMHVLENDLLTWTDDEGVTRQVRVISREIGANFIVKITGVVEQLGLDVSGSPVQTGAGVRVDPPLSLALLESAVFDGPPVIDEWSTAPGVHVVAAAAAGSTWAGATVYISTDGGANYVPYSTLEHEHPIGGMSTTLNSATPSEALGSDVVTWDTTNSVTVDFESLGTIPMVTVLEADVLAGWNWFAVLDDDPQVVEVFAARDVAVASATPNSRTLSYLLRGIRGTFQGCAGTHSIGSKVVGFSRLYYQATGEFREIAGLASAQTLLFKIVPAGGLLASTPAQSLATRLRNVEPFPIRDIAKKYNALTDDLSFDVDHWTRTNIPVAGLAPYPLDDPPEAYRFTLYHESGNGQAVFIRTKSAAGSGANALRDRSVIFTRAEQVTAGYTPGASETYWIDAQQIGQYGDSPSILQLL